MLKGTYTQITVKFPTTKERYRQALECLDERDKSKYHTQADYLTEAVLSLEGKRTPEEIMLSEISDRIDALTEKLDGLYALLERR